MVSEAKVEAAAGWHPMHTAPRDGSWILAINNRGNCAVIIWVDRPHSTGEWGSGWIHPFSDAALSPFWNGFCGSEPVAWKPLPRGKDALAIVRHFETAARARVEKGES